MATPAALEWLKQELGPNASKISGLDNVYRDPEYKNIIDALYTANTDPTVRSAMESQGITIPKASDMFSIRKTDADIAFGTEAAGQGADNLYQLATADGRYVFSANVASTAADEYARKHSGGNPELAEALKQQYIRDNPDDVQSRVKVYDQKTHGIWQEFKTGALPVVSFFASMFLPMAGPWVAAMGSAALAYAQTNDWKKALIAGVAGYVAGSAYSPSAASTAGGVSGSGVQTMSAAQAAEQGTQAALNALNAGQSATAAITTATNAITSGLPEVPSSAGLGDGALMTGNTQLGTGVQTIGTGTPGYLGAGNVPVTGSGTLAGVTGVGATSSGLNALTLSENVPALNYTPNIPDWDLGSLGDQVTGVPVNPNAPTPPTGIYNTDPSMPDTFDLDAGPGSGSGGGGLPPEAAAGASGIWDTIEAGLGSIGENILGSEGLGNISQTGIEGYFDYRGLDAIRDATERGREDVETWTNRGLGYLEPFIQQDPSKDPYMQAALADISKQVQSSAAARGMLQSGQTLQNISDTTMARAYLPYRGQNIGAAQSAGGLATGAGGNLATLAGKSGEATANWWSGLGRNISGTIGNASQPSLAEQFGQITQGIQNLQDLWNSFGSSGA